MAPDRRPAVTAGVLGDVLGVLPARLRRRLDTEPRLADDWTWSEADDVTTVEADEATVTLRPERGVISAPDELSCTCLLAPRCLHLAAVLSLLEPVASVVEAGTETALDAGTEAALYAVWAVPDPAPRQVAEAPPKAATVGPLVVDRRTRPRDRAPPPGSRRPWPDSSMSVRPRRASS